MFLVIALMAYIGQYVNAESFDVMVMLEATDNINVDSIKKISHTEAVYKVKSLLKPEVKWNFAVLAKGFSSDKEKEAYVSEITGLSSVEKSDSMVIKPSSGVVTFVNYFMKITRALGNIIGFLPTRPLKPEIPPQVECDTVDIGSDEALMAFSFMRPGDEKSFKEYGWLMMTRVLPVLNLEFIYQGVPDSKRWKLMNIQKYDSKKTFCEYMESELVIKYGPLYTKAFEDQMCLTGKKL